MSHSVLYRYGRACASMAFAVLLGATSLQAQQGRVEGTVRHAVTGDPVPSARVSVEGTTLAATSNENGYYRIDDVPTGAHSLRVQAIGYQTVVLTNQRVQPGVPSTANFQLNPSILRIEGVVVTGVAEQTSGVKLPFTVESVSGADLEVPATNAEEAIRGKVAGVKVVRGGGQPGSGSSIQLRGATSINTSGRSNEPLYVVDGVILGASMVDIDALEIEHIEVLKGAAASSMYGARAANGVVSIRTARGRNLQENETRIAVRSEFGQNQLGNPVNVSQSHQFKSVAGTCPKKFGNTCWVDDAGNPVDRETGATALDDDQFGSGVAFQDNEYAPPLFNQMELFFNPGTFGTQNVSVSHRTATTNFSSSFARTEESGVIVGLDGYERKSARVNLDHSLGDEFDLSISGFYSTSSQDDIFGNTPNPLFGLMFMPADTDLEAPNDDGTPYRIQPHPSIIEENPLYAVNNQQVTNTRGRVLGNARLRWLPVDWFDVEADFSFDRSDRHRSEFYPKGFKTIGSSTLNSGVVERHNWFDQAINASVTAGASRDFGDLHSLTKARALLERARGEWIFAHAENLVVNSVNDLDVGDATLETVSSSSDEVRSIGFFVSQDLDYADKYIGSFLVRRDGSSLFGEDERWHTYYRASGAWRMSQESFWFLDFVDEFKLRGSLGTAGGRPSFSAQYETFNVAGGAVSKANLGNKLLQPEFATETEVGVDMILGGKVQTSLTYARSEVENQILNVPLPGYFGFSSQWQNAGTLTTNTLEGTLQAALIQSADFSWSFNFVIDRTRQEITEFTLPPYRWGPSNAFYNRQGEQYGTFYGDSWLTDCSQLGTPAGANGAPAVSQGTCDLWDVNDDGYLVPVGAGNTFRDGFSKSLWGTMVDVDGDAIGDYAWGLPVLDEDLDQDGNQTTFLPLGNTTPDFNFGISQNIRWKGVSLYALFDAQVGGDIYNLTRQWGYRELNAAPVDQRGKAEELKKPVTYYAALYDIAAVNTEFVEDGTFVKFRELNLRYTLNQSQLSGVFGGFLNRVAFSFVGRNLVTWTDYTGFDPEVGQNSSEAAVVRFDGFGYPNYRTFSGSIEIEF